MVPRPVDSEITFSVFHSSSQAATRYYQSNHLKVKARNPVKSLAQRQNAGLFLHYLFSRKVAVNTGTNY